MVSDGTVEVDNSGKMDRFEVGELGADRTSRDREVSDSRTSSCQLSSDFFELSVVVVVDVDDVVAMMACRKGDGDVDLRGTEDADVERENRGARMEAEEEEDEEEAGEKYAEDGPATADEVVVAMRCG